MSLLVKCPRVDRKMIILQLQDMTPVGNVLWRCTDSEQTPICFKQTRWMCASSEYTHRAGRRKKITAEPLWGHGHEEIEDTLGPFRTLVSIPCLSLGFVVGQDIFRRVSRSRARSKLTAIHSQVNNSHRGQSYVDTTVMSDELPYATSPQLLHPRAPQHSWPVAPDPYHITVPQLLGAEVKCTFHFAH